MKSYYLLLVLFFSRIISLHADVCTWTGSGDGINWSDDDNWSCGHMPLATDAVIINSGTVTLDVVPNVTIANMTMSGGTLTGNNNISLTGALNWSGGTISGTGSMTVGDVAGAMTISNFPTLSDRTLTLNGGGALDHAFLIMEGNATVVIPQFKTFTFNSTLMVSYGLGSISGSSGTGGTLVNSGTIEKNGAGFIGLNTTITNTGTVNVNGGVLGISCEGNLSGTHTGATFDIDDGAMYDQGSGNHSYTDCTMTGLGIFYIGGPGPSCNGGNAIGNLISGNTITSGEFYVATATLNLTQNLTHPYIEIVDATVNGTGTITIPPNGIAELGGYYYGGAIINVPLINQGTIEANDLGLTATNTFVNSGTISSGEFGYGSLDLTGATVTNTGIVAPGLPPGNPIGYLQMTPFNNSAATLAIDLAGTTYPGYDYDQLSVNSAVTLSGTLNISFLNSFIPVIGNSFTIMTCTGGCSGDFATINHPGSNANAWQIDLNTPNEVRLVLVEGLNQCDWYGFTDNWSNDTQWSCGHAPTLGDEVVINGGAVTLDVANVTIASMTMSGGALSGSNNLSLTGTLTWSGGTMGGTGTTTVALATTITNAPTLDTRTLTLNGGGTIAGGFNTSNGANLIVPMDKTLTCTVNSDLAWGGNGGTVTLLGGTGTFVKNGTGNLECDFQNFQNTGTIIVDEGILRMGFGGTHNGATFLIANTFLTVKGGTHTFTGCNFTGSSFGPGALATILNGNVGTFSGNTITNMRFNLVGETSTFNLGQDLSINSFFLSGGQVVNGTGNITVGFGTTILLGGTLDFTGNLTVNGSLNWLGGTTGSGVHTIVAGSGGVVNSSVTANGPVTNISTFTVQTGTFTANGPFVNGYYGATLLLQSGSTFDANGSFENDFTATIKGKGTLDLTNATSVSIYGTVAPGLSPGILTMNPFDNSNSTLDIELAGLGGAGQLTGHDQLVVNSAVALSGNLNLSFLGGFENTIAVGNEFVIMTCSGGCSGNFGNISYPGNNPNAWEIDVTTNPNEVRLKLVQPLNICTQYIWDGSVGDWSDALKWSCGAVPGATNEVVINGGTVMLDVVPLVTIANLTMSGGTLTSDNLPGDNNISLTGALTWSGGTIGGAGSMTVAGAATITNSTTLDTRILTLNSGGTIEDNASIYAANAGELIIPATKTLTMKSNANLYGGGGGLLTLEGALVCEGSTSIDWVVNGDATGSLVVNIGSSLYIYGSETWDDMDITIGDFSNFFIVSGTQTFNNCIVSGGGTFGTFYGGVLLLETGNTVTCNLLAVGTITVNQPINFPNVTLNGGTLNGTGNITVAGYLYWSDGTIGGTGTTTVAGITTVLGLATLTRTFINSSTGVMQGTGTLDLSGGTLNNNGTIAPGLSPGILTMTSFNNSAATLAIELAGPDGAGAANGHDQLVVTGNITLGGDVEVSFLNGFAPPSGTFVILTYSGTASGTLPEVSCESGCYGSTLKLIHDAGAKTLSLCVFLADAGANIAICSGQSATLTASSAGTTTPFTYLWNTGATTASISVSPTMTTTYSVVVTDANGCTDDASTLVTVGAATITWTGGGDAVNWSDPANWSDGIVPLACQEVSIPVGSSVTVPAGFNAVGKTLDVVVSGQLTVAPTGTLLIEN